jgi:hypothetical protein
MDEDWNYVGQDRSLLCIMSSNADLSRRCSNLLISINSIAVICYAVSTLMRRSADSEGSLNTSARMLPVKMELPFDANASPLFELLAVGQILHEVSIAALVAIINSLIVTLVSFISCVINILRILEICLTAFSRSRLLLAYD